MTPRSVATKTDEVAGSAAERPPPRLVLASEALREDLAPHEPDRSSARWAAASAGLLLAVLAVAVRLGFGPSGSHAASIGFAAAGAAVALSLLPFSYSVRAGAFSGLGLLLMGLGLEGVGPLDGLGGPVRAAEDVARLVTLSTLPAALLFRARYRAYRRARLVLAGALLLAAPFAVIRSISALSEAAGPLEGAAALLVLAVLLAGLSGFMGEHTTAGGVVWAVLILTVLPADVALRELSAAPGTPDWLHLRTAIGTAAAGLLVAVGTYQVLAGRLGADARRIAQGRDALAGA
jgi:hypothetical protein